MFLKMLKNQKGQSMIEFALVLPILIVLTVGGVFFIMSFTHKSIMNGVSFMAARSASVRNNSNVPEWVKEKYIENTNSKWLEKATVNSEFKQDSVNVTLTKEAENLEFLSNALSILGHGSKNDPSKIVTSMTLPVEYFVEDGTPRPLTRKTVDYEFKYKYDLLEAILSNAVTHTIINTDQMADKKDEPGDTNDTNKDQFLSLDPLNINIKEVYKDWGMKYDSLSPYPELEEHGGYLNNLKTISDNFKLLQTGTDVIQTILTLYGGDVLNQLLKIFGTAAGNTAEGIMTKLSGAADKHVRNSFKKDSPINLGR